MIPGREEGYATPVSHGAQRGADSGLDNDQSSEADHRRVSRIVVGMQSRSSAERQSSGQIGRKGMPRRVSRYMTGESY